MAIALLMGLFPQNNYKDIIDNSRGVIQYAADALQKSIVKGIGSQYEDLEIINLPYLGSYPKRYAKLFSPIGDFTIQTNSDKSVNGHNVRYNNLTVYKNWSRLYNATQALKHWCYKNKDEKKIVIVYSIHYPFLKACVNVKQKYNDLRIIQIVPDLPEFMGSSKNRIKNIIHKIQNDRLYKLYDYVNGYVLLSRYMVERLPIGEKPWCVVEGIYDNSQFVECNIKNIPKHFILYSGTLARRYGILNLVEAYNEISNPNYELVICGAGDALDEIKGYAKQNSHIIYYGQCPREEVLYLQQKASLLVNPRTPEGAFTRYSFPSKTMEYLASGTPSLIYHLPGIPDEYYRHCFLINKLGIAALRDKLVEIMKYDDVSLKQIGLQAQQFIFAQKNPLIQTRKILDLVKTIN